MVYALLERGAILRSRDADGKRPTERAVKGWDVLKVDVLAKKGKSFATSSRDMPSVMMLCAIMQSEIKGNKTESSKDGEVKLIQHTSHHIKAAKSSSLHRKCSISS